MDLNNYLTENLEIENVVTEEKQNNFLETTLGKTINGAVDIGIKSLIPDCIENDVIEIKDAFISEGFEAGIKTAINSAIDLGKNIMGIINGKFSDVEQAENTVKSGGLIDGISNVIDFVLDKTEEKGILNENIVDLIKDGKNILLENIENKIRDNFDLQVSCVNDLNSNIEVWKNSYNNKDLETMNIAFENIQEQIGNVMPYDSLIKTAKEIENLQTIITNNNGDFDLSKEQIELSKLLV